MPQQIKKSTTRKPSREGSKGMNKANEQRKSKEVSPRQKQGGQKHPKPASDS